MAETVARIQIRRDTTANWAAQNPILAVGEMGLDMTLMRVKVGDGGTPWSGLEWAVTLGEQGEQGPQGEPGDTGLPGPGAVPADEAVAAYVATPGTDTEQALTAKFVPVVGGSVVTYSGGLPATETLPSGVVKTYHWDSNGNPVTADWNMPTGPDYVETFTYDGDGNATGSTFAEA